MTGTDPSGEGIHTHGGLWIALRPMATRSGQAPFQPNPTTRVQPAILAGLKQPMAALRHVAQKPHMAGLIPRCCGGPRGGKSAAATVAGMLNALGKRIILLLVRL